MARHEIDSLSDPRLEPYREVRHRNWTELSGIFIAEGLQLVQQLLASDYQCQSILLDRKYEAYLPANVDENIDVLTIEHAAVAQILGFNFHRGILACGVRKPAAKIQTLDRIRPAETIVGLLGIQDPENVGGLLRTCAALGIQKIVIGPGCADPLSRRSLRVSMGNALKLQLFHSRDLCHDAAWLHSELQVTRYAASPLTGKPGLGDRSLRLDQIRNPQSSLVILGNERDGLPDNMLYSADYLVRIDMHSGVDSLNVCVAGGLYCTT